MGCSSCGRLLLDTRASRCALAVPVTVTCVLAQWTAVAVHCLTVTCACSRWLFTHIITCDGVWLYACHVVACKHVAHEAIHGGENRASEAGGEFGETVSTWRDGTCTAHDITSRHITSHHVISHHITTHHITSHHITSHRMPGHARTCHVHDACIVTFIHPHLGMHDDTSCIDIRQHIVCARFSHAEEICTCDGRSEECDTTCAGTCVEVGGGFEREGI